MEFDWRMSGLRCLLRVPHDRNKQAGQHLPGDQRRFDERAFQAKTEAGEKHVLLVEDEPLVSMMLADLLSTFGESVVGRRHLGNPSAA